VKTAFALGAVALAAQLLGGCAGLSPTPYNGRESCDGVGGIYTADGRCLGGTASLETGAGAGGAAPGTLHLELGYRGERPVDLPLPRPDVGADTAQAVRAIEARRKAEALAREGRPDPTRRPDLDRDVTQGIQSRGVERALGR
jgi:hypothetical protein